MDKKHDLLLQLNKLEQNQEDFTLVNVKFIIMDEYLNGNNQVVERDVLESALSTLKDKPIVVKYFKVSEAGEKDDYLGDHEMFVDEDREGNKYINTDTISIGHFTTEGYFEEYNGKDVVMCEGVLYADRHKDIIALLQEWIDSGIKINSSVEYYYKNYEVKDGIEYIKLPLVFSGHCLLNSEARGNSEVIPGAYDDSQLLSINQKILWNKAVEQDKSINNTKKEGEGMEFFKKTCQLSHEDIRSKLYGELEKKVTAEEYWDMWISEVYDTYFIYCTWDSENTKYNYFKVEYTKDDSANTVEVNLESKVGVERDWVEVQNQLSVNATKIAELESEIAKKDETITSLNSEKETLSTNLGEATEKLTSLNSKITELAEIEKKYNDEKFEEALNQRKSEFETKFKAVNAIEKFESDEVQEMVKNSIEDETILNSLNALVVSLIQAPKEEKEENKLIKDFNNKKVVNLIPKNNSFESRYMEE